MRYIPLTETEQQEMLAAIGASSVDELFHDIPDYLRLKHPLNLPSAMSEWALLHHARQMSSENVPHDSVPCFLGAGSYRHFIPAIVPYLVSRTEFLTAYTPYQPEISQGSLQAIFEYQTMMTQLTGLDVSNASLYDGAMATAEAALLAHRVTKKTKIGVSKGLTPSYRRTLETYIHNQNIELIDLDLSDDGTTLRESIQSLPLDDVGAVIIQSPNFLGVIESVSDISNILKSTKTLLITVVTEALSLGILNPPGAIGADIVCGEAQSLGLPTSFGGPYLGFFTCKKELLRQLPGRIVGMTKDTNGNCGFVNTLSTREQHIRREKATSNICTNQALCALSAAIYMATMGRQGLRKLALLNMKKSAYLKQRIMEIPGFVIPFSGFTFNEFCIRVPGSLDQLLQKLESQHIIAGFDLRNDYPELGESMLLCATEINSKEHIDRFITILNDHAAEVLR